MVLEEPSRRDLDLVAPAQGTVFDTILAFFRTQLDSGRLKAGDRLQPERRLAEILGVSRPSLREALRAMALLGLVEIRHGQGAFIRQPDPSSLANYLGLALAMAPALASGFVDIRIALECEAVRLACAQRDEHDLHQIGVALSHMPRSRIGGDLGAKADFEFHKAIVAATHNESLIFLYQAIEEFLRRSHEERRALVFDVPGAIEALANAHEAIYGAIEARDEERAVQETRRHFHLVRDFYGRIEGEQHE